MYAGLLSVYTYTLPTSSAQNFLLVTGVILLVVSLFTAFYTDKIFQRRNYQPEIYYRYFYRDGGNFVDPTEKRILERIEGEFLHRYLSPRKITFVFEVLLLVFAVWIAFGQPFL